MNDTTMTIADSYWNMLKGLSKEVKLNLIARLSSSITEENKDYLAKDDELTKNMIKRFCGTWTGEESAEEIISSFRKIR